MGRAQVPSSELKSTTAVPNPMELKSTYRALAILDTKMATIINVGGHNYLVRQDFCTQVEQTRGSSTIRTTGSSYFLSFPNIMFSLGGLDSL